MKVTIQKQGIIWFLKPEDSSDAETGSCEQSSTSQGKTGLLYASIKVFLCYATALAITLFLSRLH